MPEPFKNVFNITIIHGMAMHFKKQWSQFDAKAFEVTAANNLEALELKARSQQITEAMIQYLPNDFVRAGNIMMGSLGTKLNADLSAGTINNDGIAGWGVMPMADYIGLCGHDHFDLSMTLLKEMTKCFSSEFAIRFFLLASPTETLAVLKVWATDDNHHVRRLVSEGSRPRLPWAMKLPLFIEKPSPIIELLNMLKDDDEEYVRRSVANNLNDIAKDHPDVVADIAEQWLKDANKERKKLVRHACRTLIKKGHKKTLRVLGYSTPKIQQVKIDLLTPEVKFGHALQFTLFLGSKSSRDQALMIDYIIHHQKANGSTSPKVFKWKVTSLLAKQALVATKKHPMKKITTRVYYPGVHFVEVVVNGLSVAKADFELIMPS